MPLALYPEIVTKKDLSPDEGYGPDIDDVCNEIDAATKGWGANKQRVINALAAHDATTRVKISKRYKELKGVELDTLMKKEFSGDLEDALRFLSLPPDQAEALMIKTACKGIGAHADIIYTVCGGRTNEEMNLLKKAYFDRYTKDMGQLLAHELTGNMEVLIFNCIQAAEETFDPQFHTMDKAKEDAEIIYKKGQGKMGTEEKGIFKVICASPPEHLEQINNVYADKYGYTLLKTMEKELNGNLEDATLYLVGMKLKPYETAAKTIKLACAGAGTNELLLTCCIIRYEPVLSQVMTAHIELYGQTIQQRIRDEVSGAYKTLLLKLCDRVWPDS